MDRPNEWDIAVGHYLGVDHASHVFKVDSLPVAKKLEQMDDEITWFLKKLLHSKEDNSSTLMLVCGDHGMKLNGEHAGGTKEEIETALIAIDVQRLKHRLSSLSSTAQHQNDLTVYDMNQMDLAASLAILLGVPIPFGNVGQVSERLLKLGVSSKSPLIIQDALKVNAWQVFSFTGCQGQICHN